MRFKDFTCKVLMDLATFSVPSRTPHHHSQDNGLTPIISMTSNDNFGSLM